MRSTPLASEAAARGERCLSQRTHVCTACRVGPVKLSPCKGCLRHRPQRRDGTSRTCDGGKVSRGTLSGSVDL